MQFRWVGKLGKGGFGEVWRAICGDNREYAVKFIKEPYATAILRRFEREGVALRTLKHPYIVSFVGFMDFEVGPGLVMEYLPGGSLRDRLTQGRPRVSRAIEIAYAVLDALHHAHGAGFVHRDIKPDNILFTSGGVPKVGDFGLVKLLSGDADGLTVGIPGTVGYIAPELVENPRTASPQVDIFSAGVTLYEMLTLRKLQFEGQRILPPSRFNPAVNGDLDAVVLRMVASDPNRRYATADAAAKTLGPIWKVYRDWEAEQDRRRQEAERARNKAIAEAVGTAACAVLLIGLVALLGGK